MLVVTYTSVLILSEECSNVIVSICTQTFCYIYDLVVITGIVPILIFGLCVAFTPAEHSTSLIMEHLLDNFRTTSQQI